MMTTTSFQRKILCTFLVLLFLFIIHKNFNSNSDLTDKIYKDICLVNQANNVNKEENNLIEISKILQKTAQKMGQLSCQLPNKNIDVSANGGWCAKSSGAESKQHVVDDKLVQYLSKFLKGKKVASFGDGPGLYKKKVTQLNEVISYDAFDGAPFAEETTENRCRFLDLSVPIYHLNQYEWVMSFEVAEHIPKEFEQIYLDNVVRYAKDGIILSWSKPGQGGFSHVNNQPFEYVQAELLRRGFKLDIEKSKEIKENSTFYWFKSNLNVYRRI